MQMRRTHVLASVAGSAIASIAAAQPVATNLGAVGSGTTLNVTNITMTQGAVNWYQFSIADEIQQNGSLYLDIDTEGTFLSGPGGESNDSMVGLYDASGNRIVTDDDEGSGLLSQLSFGGSAAPRPAVGNGVAYNGRDGSLQPGTYYVVIAPYFTTFGLANWDVTTTSVRSGTGQLNIASGTVVLGACCFSGGICTTTTPASCAAGGGTYGGDNTTCGSIPCGGPGEYSYSGPVVDMPQSPGGGLCGTTVAIEIVVPDSFVVTDAMAGVFIPHTWQGDVHARLIHDGVTVSLVNRAGVSASTTVGFLTNNFGNSSSELMYFNDAAALRYQQPDITTGIDNVTGQWKPDTGMMASFVGTNAQGVWRLEAEDCAAGDLGSLNMFALALGGAGTGGCYANCDNSTTPPTLNVADFTCFLQSFAAGCP